jgi:transcriptional regulator with XRE-family HTH domain
MPRPERALRADDPFLADFALKLRELRAKAGQPTYRKLAERAGYAASVLSQAASGRDLPTLAVTLAYVEACEGNKAEWEERWNATNRSLQLSRWRQEIAGQAPALTQAEYRATTSDVGPRQNAVSLRRKISVLLRHPIAAAATAAAVTAAAFACVDDQTNESFSPEPSFPSTSERAKAPEPPMTKTNSAKRNSNATLQRRTPVFAGPEESVPVGHLDPGTPIWVECQRRDAGGKIRNRLGQALWVDDAATDLTKSSGADAPRNIAICPEEKEYIGKHRDDGRRTNVSALGSAAVGAATISVVHSARDFIKPSDTMDVIGHQVGSPLPLKTITAISQWVFDRSDILTEGISAVYNSNHGKFSTNT